MVMTLNPVLTAKKGEMHQMCRETKVILNTEGVVYHEYTSQDLTIDQYFYLQVLRCLHDAVCCQQPQKWQITW